MAEYPKDLKYTKDHEWARRDGNKVLVGVTWHAQDALGEVVYVELPKVGTVVASGKQFGVIESTKAVSELFSPISGKVTKVNAALSDAPDAINKDPYKTGWIVEIEAAAPAELDALMDSATYEKHLASPQP
ncbi:MAG: glycine cleavage system protein GcvH [Myxococcaceae bacterium]|nr:glycine cleavage system protein GcvH [Myxococcaceae bacterium]